MNTLLTPPEGRRRPPDEHQITQRQTRPHPSPSPSPPPPPRVLLTYLLTYLIPGSPGFP